jgi:hypothetical protein
MPGPAGATAAVESIAVGAFGACIGGEFVAGLFRGVGQAGGFSIGSLAFALASAFVMLVLLRVMRTAVGPLAPQKRKRRR